MASLGGTLKLLTLLHFYLPGYKAGGPIRTVANLVSRLGHEFDFSIVTSDRDFGDTCAYASIDLTKWTREGLASVFYLPPGFSRLWRLVRLIRTTPYDVLYLNSLFDPQFTLLPLLLRRLGLLVDTPVILAPRGEFSSGALGLKKKKKSLFLACSRLLGLYHGVIWQASSEYEANDIRSCVGVDANVRVAPNLPSIRSSIETTARARHSGEPLRVAFLSRISPKKNLDLALRVLQGVHSNVDFVIVGPNEDRLYVEKCIRLAEALPQNIKVQWYGAVLPEEVSPLLAQQDLFFLPTRGENYGHVIAESLLVGTPVLLSDTTPWRDLEAAGVGWDLPLDDESVFARVIEHCAQLSTSDYSVWRKRVLEYAKSCLEPKAILEANRRLFLAAGGQHPGPLGS